MKHNIMDLMLRPYMFSSPSDTDFISRDDLMIRTGVSRRELSYYVKARAVSPPIGRTSSARYTVKHLNQIQRVKDLRKQGFTVKEIAEAFAENIPQIRPEKVEARTRSNNVERENVHRLTTGIRIVTSDELLPTEVKLLNELLKVGSLNTQRRAKLVSEAITRDDKLLNREAPERRRALRSRK